MLKTLAIRMFFIYAITSFFRRSPTPAATPGGANQAPGSPMLPSTNIYDKGTIMVRCSVTFHILFITYLCMSWFLWHVYAVIQLMFSICLNNVGVKTFSSNYNTAVWRFLTSIVLKDIFIWLPINVSFHYLNFFIRYSCIPSNGVGDNSVRFSYS